MKLSHQGLFLKRGNPYVPFFHVRGVGGSGAKGRQTCVEGGASVDVTWSRAPPTHLHPQARCGSGRRQVACCQGG